MWLINRIWRILSSRDVAIILLFIITFMLILGSVLPNPNFMSKEDVMRLQKDRPLIYAFAIRFNTQSMAKGYIFGFIGIFLIISTTACSMDRFFERHRTKRVALRDLPLMDFDIRERLENPEDFIRRLRKHLMLKRWFVREEGSEKGLILLAEKGVIGFWGSIIFHAILITLLIGLMIYYFKGYRATILLTEGQTKRLAEEEIDRIDRRPLFGLALPPLEITLKRFIPVYWKKTEPVDYTGYFQMRDTRDGRQWQQIIKINEPFRYAGMEFLMVLYGYSPNFMVYKNERLIFDSYVAIKGVPGEEDSFNITSDELLVRTILFPDFRVDEKGNYTTASPLPRNPVLLIKVQDRVGKTLLASTIGLGEEKVFGPYRLRFNDLRYWITLNLVRETGIGFFFWCGLVGILGILIRFIDPDRKIFFVFEGDHLSVVSYTKHFEGILKEETATLIKKMIAQ